MAMSLLYRIWRRSPLVVQIGMMAVGLFIMQRWMRHRIRELF